jgi:HSP20 family protein
MVAREELTPLVGSPFTFMRRFTEEMDKLFTDFGWGNNLAPLLGFLERETAPAMWSPKVEVARTEGQMTVRADLPGLNKEDIAIELADGVLTLKGERKKETTEEKEGYYRSEHSYGSFYRSLPLPKNVEADKAAASYRDGVLEITLPLAAQETAVRRLAVTEPPQAKAAKK